MKHLAIAATLICLAAAAWACGGDSSAAPGEAQAASKASSSSPSDDGSGGDRSASPEGDSSRVEEVERSSPDVDGSDGEHSSSSSGDDDPAGHGNGDDDGSDSGYSSSPEDDGSTGHDNGDDDGSGSGYSSSSEDDGSTGHGNGDDDGSGSGYSSSSGDDDVVAYENPGFIGVPFDGSRNDALVGAQPLDVVTWTVEPTASFGSLEAEGVLGDGATLFNPNVDGEGAGFIIYFKDFLEPMVLLLPDLGPLYIWETDETVAPTELEVEGGSFTLRAYSPLFMDVGPGDLTIRLFGYDGNGEDALLGVRPVEAAGP